jgi:hypothetical protein
VCHAVLAASRLSVLCSICRKLRREFTLGRIWRAGSELLEFALVRNRGVVAWIESSDHLLWLLCSKGIYICRQISASVL